MSTSFQRILVLSLCLTGALACSSPKCRHRNCLPTGRVSGEFSGALLGASSGAITGFQLGAGSGPGVAVGAGFGALAGGIRGAVHDMERQELKDLEEELAREELRSQAQGVIASVYNQRIKHYPGRDIYAADLFFEADSHKLSTLGQALVKEIARMNRDRLSWSRFGIIAYVRSRTSDSAYASHLAEHRALEIANTLVEIGFEPRRLVASGVVTEDVLIKDQSERPGRFGQAIEFKALDR